MNREQIQQRINEIQALWNTLSKRIEAIKRDLAIELDRERQVILQKRLADLEGQRDKAEADLKRLEAEQSQVDREKSASRIGPRVINLRPLDVTHTFKDREREIKAFCEYLSNDSVCLISIVGRGGIGKTALACHVLGDLEQSMLPACARKNGFAVDGILYLNSRSTGLSLDRIYTDVGRMLGEPLAGRLAARWASRDTPLKAKIEYLLETMQGGLYLILLNNLEDYLSKENTIAEEGLRLFIECCLVQPTGAKLIVTSREQINVTSAGLHNVRSIVLREGLPEQESIFLLRELDPQGMLGFQDALEDELEHAAQLTSGIPRALEIMAGILHRDPTASLNELLDDKTLFGEQVVERLVAEGYRHLGEEERRVMEALAIFDRPATVKAVAYLLAAWFPDLDVRGGLRLLVGSYFVNITRATREYSLHPLDRDYAYHQLSNDEGESVYNRQNLELRAADYYASIRKPQSEWQAIDDLAPQLLECEHCIRARDYHRACRVLTLIDRDYLLKWGHPSVLVALRERLLNRLTDLHLRVDNLASLGNTYYDLAMFEQAIGCHENASEIAHNIGDRAREEQNLRSLGRAHYYLGHVKHAIKFYEQAATIAHEIGDRRDEAEALGCLGVVYREQGQAEQAMRLIRKAMTIVSEAGDHQAEDRLFGRLALTFRDLGQFEKAIEFCEQALLTSREISFRRGEGRWLGFLGMLYYDLGQFERAIGFFEGALVIAREIRDLRHEAIWLDNLGTTHYLLGQIEQAINLYQDALDLSRQMGYRLGESYQLLGLSRALLANNRPSEARQYCTQALSLEMSRTHYQAALVLGTVLLHQQDPGVDDAFRDASARCQIILDQTAGLYKPRYTLAASLLGQAVCDLRWSEEYKHAELLTLALAEYRRALDNCSAKGVVHDAIRDLELIQRAGIEGLEPVFELFEPYVHIDEMRE